jgi:hypothetical protein
MSVIVETLDRLSGIEVVKEKLLDTGDRMERPAERGVGLHLTVLKGRRGRVQSSFVATNHINNSSRSRSIVPVASTQSATAGNRAPRLLSRVATPAPI